MSRKHGFTLIELITVIAITTILMTIIFVPVIQGFNLTRAAQAFADAQDRARGLMRTIEREVGNGAAVRDNTGTRGAITIVVPAKPGVAPPNDWVATTLYNMKLDIFKPAEGDPTRGPGGGFINPDTGKEDPTLTSPKGQVNLPATAGMSMVRYFAGLRAPVLFNANGQPIGAVKYNNPYDGLLAKVNGQQDNLYVLYRADVQVKIWDRNLNKYVVNTALFQDANGDDEPDDLDDPAFFTIVPGIDCTAYPNSLTAAGVAKGIRIGNWLSKAKVVTEVSRYDMIAPVYNKTTRQVFYVNNVPQIVPLVRFQPTRVTNEPAAGQTAVRTGEEGANMAKVGPDAFTTKYGAWADLLMRLWPSAWPSNFAVNGDRAGNQRNRWGTDPQNPSPPYMVGRTWYLGANKVERFSLFYFDPVTMVNGDLVDGLEVFDVSKYLEIRRLPKPDVNAVNYDFPYAFSDAVADANARSGWTSNATALLNFVPFVPDPRNGKVISSFESRDFGVDRSVPYDYRVPTYGQQTTTGLSFDLKTGIRVSPYDANLALDYTPNNDPDIATGAWTDVLFQPINRRFNKLWADFPVLAPGLDRAQYVKRYVDLRVCPMPDGTAGPLDPSNGVARGYITPGSELVVGPDQKPGPNYGKYVRYQRVTQRPVGANQYMINYVDQPEPDYGALGVNFGGTVGNLYDPLNYSGNNVLQAVIQPQYRAGYVELNSRFGEPIPSGYTDLNGFHPTGNIFFTYRFQYTEPTDVVAVDYDSTQVMEVTLTIRNYPQTQNIPNPQSITVKGSAEVRNFVR